MKKSWTPKSKSSYFADFHKAYVNLFGSTKSERRAKTELTSRLDRTSDESKLLEYPEAVSTTVASKNEEGKVDSIISSTRITCSDNESINGIISPEILLTIDKWETSSCSKDPALCIESKKKLKKNEAVARKTERNLKGPYSCDLCGKKFRLRSNLKSHTRTHTGEKQFTCHICGKQFVQTGCLYYHLKHVHGGVKNHSCDICGRSFAMKTTMEDHRRSIHTGERPFVCDSCGKTFKTKSSLYIHSRIHTKLFPHECKYCKKVFRWRQQLLGHLTIHTGEKNHTCDVCGKAFGVKNHLTRHKRTHSDDKPFNCLQCNMSFGQKRYLTTHQRSRHK